MVARPVELGVMLGGANGVAVDAVACRLMGFDPQEIDHLNYLDEAGIGPLSTGDIEVDRRRSERPRQSLRPARPPSFRGSTTTSGSSRARRSAARSAAGAW